MTPGPRPPRLPRWVLRRLLPRGLRGEAILGDLDEEFHLQVEQTAPWRARAWYTRQALRISFELIRGGISRSLIFTGNETPGGPVATFLDHVAEDVRYSLRRLGRRPGFLVAGVGTIALGIGANTAIFSLLDAVILRPLPFPEADRLVQVWETNPEYIADRGLEYDDISINALNFLEYRKSPAVTDLAFTFRYRDRGQIVVGGGDAPPQVTFAMGVSPSFFSVLGVQPALGRTFLPEERAPPGEYAYLPVAIITHDLWVRRFGADRDVLGSRINLDGGPSTVVGIMPEGFEFPPMFFHGEVLTEKVEILLPLHYESFEQPRNFRQFMVLGRLADGYSAERAQEELSLVTAGLTAEFPEIMSGWRLVVTPLRKLPARDFGGSLYTLMGIVGFVLLIACVNLANLLMAQGSMRRGELSIRQAMGGGRARQIQLLLTESLLLTTMGGLAGLLLARWGLQTLIALSPAQIPYIADAGIDARVLGFTLALSVFTGLFFGLLPALRSSDIKLTETLKATSGTGRRWLSRAHTTPLIVLQIGLTLMLLVGGGLLGKSFFRLNSEEKVYDPSNVLVVNVTTGARHDWNQVRPQDMEGRRQRWAQYQRMLESVRAVRGVRSVAFGRVPLDGNEGRWPIQFREYEGRVPEDEVVRSGLSHVSPDFFETMRIPILRGTGLPDWDGVNDWERYWWATACNDRIQAYCKVLVSESFAAGVWPGEDPIGKRLGVFGCCWTVAGVVPDIRYRGVDAIALGGKIGEGYHVYVPDAGGPLLVRTAGDPLAYAAQVREAIAGVRGDLALSVTTMEQQIADSLAGPRFYMLTAVAFAVVALFLALVGLYAVIAYSVSRRTHEIGVRMALGASTTEIRQQVVAEAFRPVLAGVLVGLAGATSLVQVLEQLMYGMSPMDPGLMIGLAALLIGAAVLASYMPARRASSVAPVQALTAE